MWWVFFSFYLFYYCSRGEKFDFFHTFLWWLSYVLDDGKKNKLLKKCTKQGYRSIIHTLRGSNSPPTVWAFFLRKIFKDLNLEFEKNTFNTLICFSHFIFKLNCILTIYYCYCSIIIFFLFNTIDSKVIIQKQFTILTIVCLCVPFTHLSIQNFVWGPQIWKRNENNNDWCIFNYYEAHLNNKIYVSRYLESHVKGLSDGLQRRVRHSIYMKWILSLKSEDFG